MTLVFLIIAGVPLLVFTAALVATAFGIGRVTQVRRLPVGERSDWPRVSIIVPACNEGEGIEAALRTVLAQGHPNVEVVAVDDRSSDQTGAIIDRLATGDPRLVVVHIDSLPEGWLGKLNALQRGVEKATGEWLLFADADVHLGPRTLQKCIGHAEANGIDFISVVPQIATAGFLGDAVFNVLIATLCLGLRPWRIRDPRSTAIGASGAFMLVRRTAFARTPGFEWLKLEVADDFGLCLMLKTHGGRCDLLLGREDVQIAWYASLTELTQKMQKNFFAITGRFSVLRIAGQAALLAWLALFPLAALLPVEPSMLRSLVLVPIAVQLGAAAVANRWCARPMLPSLLPGVGFLLLALIMLRSALIGWRRGGIEWRGVLYPTSLLRARQRVRV